jgi:hypothetical protein
LADETLPENAVVLAEAIDVLYYCNRKGWYLDDTDRLELSQLLAFRGQGAEYIVLGSGLSGVADNVRDYLTYECRLVGSKGDSVLIYFLLDLKLENGESAPNSWPYAGSSDVSSCYFSFAMRVDTACAVASIRAAR